MKEAHETIHLEIRDYLSPECSYKVEDIVNAIDYVIDSSFDPVNHQLAVTVQKRHGSC